MDTSYERIHSQQLRLVTSRRVVAAAAAMDPLAVVEEKLGSVDRWPSCVLTDMFYEESKVRFSRRVAAFLYENGVRDDAKLYMASRPA